MISAIGNSVAENHVSLRAEKNGITELEMFPSNFACKMPVGEIKIVLLFFSTLSIVFSCIGFNAVIDKFDKIELIEIIFSINLLRTCYFKTQVLYLNFH